MKFLNGLIKHRFHVLGLGVSYANMIGFGAGFALVTFLTR